MIKISLISPSARHNEACGHGGRALCRIVHLFKWRNSTTRAFSAILNPENTPYSAKNFCNGNSAKYTFSNFHIQHSAKYTFPSFFTSNLGTDHTRYSVKICQALQQKHIAKLKFCTSAL